jgi:hypothetical protein
MKPGMDKDIEMPKDLETLEVQEFGDEFTLPPETDSSEIPNFSQSPFANSVFPVILFFF